MASLRSRGRKLSFDILGATGSFSDEEQILLRSSSDPIAERNENGVGVSPSEKAHKRKRKNRGSKKKKKISEFPISEESIIGNDESVVSSNLDDCNHLNFDSDSCAAGVDVSFQNYSSQTVVREERTTVVEETGSFGTARKIAEPEKKNGYVRSDLRQRNVSGGGGVEEDESRVEGNGEGETSTEPSSSGKQRVEANGTAHTKLETAESLDWKQLMADDPNYIFLVEKSPVQYFMEELYGGNSLQSTTTIGNEKERERVYDTIFRLPWRCELLIDVGFLVCFDSFLSLLTLMPARIMIALWRLAKTGQLKRPSAAELCDFGCFIVLACGVFLLEQTDISLIYHMIRGQGTIKLYVVYNVLEIFDRLFQSFGGDVLQALFNSAEGFATCPPENIIYWLWRLISDQALAVAALILHSFVLLAQAITLSTCIVAHNNALMALLVSNNFSEIKSNVFKRFNKDNIHSLVLADSIERFHISSFLLFVLAQNILEAEGPWFQSFFLNALLVYICEMAIDIIKHSFLAKFNNIKPIAYSEFLEDLCKQTLNIQSEDGKKNLIFVPLAPACVVIRVLTPIYGAHLPYGPLPWRIFWISIFSAVTYVMLGSLKVLVGIILRKHATWYINRCERRRQHLHYD